MGWFYLVHHCSDAQGALPEASHYYIVERSACLCVRSALGARCILVGIGPEVAQALVASGANPASLITRADLRSAVEDAARGYGFTFAKG